jgi:hypothetical protein
VVGSTSEQEAHTHAHTDPGVDVTDIAGERARLERVGLKIEHRETWGAAQDYDDEPRRVVRPARRLFLHIAVINAPARNVTAERAAMRTIERIGQDRFGIGSSYNAAACQSGRLYELQPLTRRGAHTVNDLPNPALPEGSLNYDSRALVLPQNVADDVTEDQLHAAARWGAALCLSGEAVRDARWWGHRDVTQKACPGPIAYDEIGRLNQLTRHYVTHGLTEDPMTPEQEQKLDRALAALNRVENTHFPRTVDSITGAIRRENEGGILVVAETFKAGDPVYYVSEDFSSKLQMVQDGPMHQFIMDLHVMDGKSVSAQRWPAARLDEIPTVVAS